MNSEKTDAFSFAVCLYEMVSGREPWEQETHAQVAYQVRKKNLGPANVLLPPFLPVSGLTHTLAMHCLCLSR